MVTNVDEIQPVPILLDLPNKIPVGSEPGSPVLLSGTANLLTPQIVGDEVEEVAQAEGEDQRVGPGAQGQQVATEEFQVGAIVVQAIRLLEVGQQS